MKKWAKSVIVLFIVGILIIIAGFSMNGVSQVNEVYEKDGGWGWNIGTFGGTKDFSQEYSAVSEINIDIRSSEVIIKEYDGDKVLVEAESVSNKTSIGLENGKLKIKEKGVKVFLGFNIGFQGGKITVSLPKETTFSEIDVEVNGGVVTVQDTLQAKEVSIEVNAGSVNATKIIAKEVDLKVNVGNIYIELLDSQETDVDCNIGEIDVTMVGSLSDYTYKTKCDIGELTIGTYSSSGISNKEQGGYGDRDLQAKCNIGEVTIRMEN